jgi:hypothetical protein
MIVFADKHKMNSIRKNSMFHDVINQYMDLLILQTRHRMLQRKIKTPQNTTKY